MLSLIVLSLICAQGLAMIASAGAGFFVADRVVLRAIDTVDRQWREARSVALATPDATPDATPAATDTAPDTAPDTTHRKNDQTEGSHVTD